MDVNKMTDDQLVGFVAKAVRASVARRLLAGNDAACFSTGQYREAFDRENEKLFGSPLRWVNITPEDHLRSIPGFVREVSPGVWADAREPGKGKQS